MICSQLFVKILGKHSCKSVLDNSSKHKINDSLTKKIFGADAILLAIKEKEL